MTAPQKVNAKRQNSATATRRRVLIKGVTKKIKKTVPRFPRNARVHLKLESEKQIEQRGKSRVVPKTGKETVRGHKKRGGEKNLGSKEKEGFFELGSGTRTKVNVESR